VLPGKNPTAATLLAKPVKYIPAGNLAVLRRQARDCRACPLWRRATQTVFGAGPARAQIMLVGEQPGLQEDLQGVPFVGPAGQLLDRALQEAGLDRRALYLTNTVKHFKYEPRGKLRLHKRANAAEQEACARGWRPRSAACSHGSSSRSAPWRRKPCSALRSASARSAGAGTRSVKARGRARPGTLRPCCARLGSNAPSYMGSSCAI